MKFQKCISADIDFPFFLFQLAIRDDPVHEQNNLRGPDFELIKKIQKFL